jgi:hypothetical protein
MALKFESAAAPADPPQSRLAQWRARVPTSLLLVSLVPIDLPVPDPSASCEDRGSVLRVTGVPGGPFEVRVDDGYVFGRYTTQEPRVWTDVSTATVLAFFAANSPVATFLRTNGAVPLRQFVLDTSMSGSDSGVDSGSDGGA